MLTVLQMFFFPAFLFVLERFANTLHTFCNIFVRTLITFCNICSCFLSLIQARDDILNGSHPVSFEKACEFSGIQAQIQFGPHVEHKHKPGFLE